MARTEFQMAVEAEEEAAESAEAEIVYDQEFGFGDFTLHTRIPTSTEILAFLSRGSNGGLAGVNAVWRLLRRVADPVDYRTLDNLVEAGKISYGLLYGGDEDNEVGVIDLLIERATANPTNAPTASTPSPNRAGQRSTGRSRGTGSTRSSSTRANS